MTATTDRRRELLLNDFAVRSFRDIADQDYICARLAYRFQLLPQFLWAGQQAIEKYLKGILLLNRIAATDVLHDLEKALRYAEGLPFRLALSDGTCAFIEHLGRFGPFRYLESSYFVIGPALRDLDRAVWEVRRYCRTLPWRDGRAGERSDAMDAEILAIEALPPHRCRIPGGILESIIDDRNHQSRPALIWQNGFFGTRARSSVRIRVGFHATNSPLTLFPEILEDVRKYVLLPGEVVRAVRDGAKHARS